MYFVVIAYWNIIKARVSLFIFIMEVCKHM